MTEFVNQNNELNKKVDYYLSKLQFYDEFSALTYLQVLKIEKKIGYKLPDLFKLLITKVGFNILSLNGGPIANDYIYLSIYNFTGNHISNPSFKPEILEDIEEFYQPPFDFPKYILPLVYVSSECPFCLDLSLTKDGDCPVYGYEFYGDMWDANPSGQWETREGGISCKYPTRITDTFEEFITKFIDKTLELYPKQLL